MALLHVVDQLLDDDRLAYARAAEEPDLATLHERGDQVDDLDAGLEELGLGLEVGELRRLAMDRPALGVRGDRRAAVHRLAEHVEDPAERWIADGTVMGEPVSIASMPRRTPSVVLIATART